MNNIRVSKNEMLLSRKGEIVRLSACGKNAIRFQSFSDCNVIDEDYSLMPQNTKCTIEDNGTWGSVNCGNLKAVIGTSGRIVFYRDGKEILAEKPELTFGDDIIFAPIVNKGQTEKEVYIPDGEWILTKDKSVFTKSTYKLNAEVDEFIAFIKSGSDVLECFDF